MDITCTDGISQEYEGSDTIPTSKIEVDAGAQVGKRLWAPPSRGPEGSAQENPYGHPISQARERNSHLRLGLCPKVKIFGNLGESRTQISRPQGPQAAENEC